jgi:hypothetical protein
MTYATIDQWSANPDENANQSGIPMYEGMSPAQLNDSIRTIMAAIFSEFDNSTMVAAIDASNISGANVTAWQKTLNIPAGLNNPNVYFQTGDVKTTYSVTAPAGWVLLNGNTIGNPLSGASGFADNSTQNLFTLLWQNCPSLLVYSAGTQVARGATAAADWSTNRALAVPNAQGQFLRVFDPSNQIDYNRPLGSLQADEMQGFAVRSGVGANNGAGSIYGTTTADCPGTGTGYTAQNAGAPPQQSSTKIVTDGTNGTPRFGAETRAKNISVNLMVCL